MSVKVGNGDQHVTEEYQPVDLTQCSIYTDTSWRTKVIDVEDGISDVNRMWNVCIQCDEHDTKDERYKTTCCGNSIDDRKFINGGISLAVAGAISTIVASFFNSVPVMIIGGSIAVGGLAVALSPKVIKCLKN